MAYQDGDTLAVVHMTNTDGLLVNEFVNTFAFRRTTVPAEANFLAMVDAIDDFYNGVDSDGHHVADYIGQAVSRSATHHIAFYSIDEGPLGSPVWDEPWLGPSASIPADSNIPTECAAVLSFHADLSGVLEEVGATRPRARRRGRIYVGPLNTNAIQLTSDSPLINPNMTFAMRAAAVRLIDSGDTTGNIWGVWSRANEEVYPVVGGWTDNAPDTQRRRGLASTSRVTYG